ncbi:M48 family metalloprotease [Archangium minus]|uniref:M48 family metalloprotease n=1 Tax=Archangium minus TaxID=83450 RepID=A0ABY9WI17_9BACT|nr:M48 family metalloprotease [Archangium minus]
MEFSREKFDAEVARLERVAARSPGAYKLRVVLLGALGYAYLLTGLLFLLGIIGGLALLASHGRNIITALKVGLPLLLLVGAVGKALWVRLSPPEGRELPRGPETEALWAEVEAVRQKLGGPVIHTLLLNDEFNAAIVQLPRFGLLGPTKNYLVLGLPLMQALSPEHFRAVLAHEFGHLSGAHGRTSAWVYRVRRTWGQVHETLEQQEGWGVAIFTRFFRWYAPFYAAYSFVLARSNEYEADRASADVVGRATAADALVAGELRHAQLEERFWSLMNERATREPEPARPHSEMAAALKSELEPTLARKWLDRGLARSTDSTDTHPCLRDRVCALGEEPRLPGRLERSAAETLLGAALPTFAAELDGGWRASVTEKWTQAYGRAQEGRKRLAELESRSPEAPLSLEEEWERASLTEDYRDAEAALPLFRRLLERSPGHVSAHFALGRLLLARGEEAGLGHLEEAMKRDTDAILPACEHAMHWLEAHGREEEARAWRTRGETWARTMHESKEERDSLRKSDTFEPHGLTEAELQMVVAQLLGGYPRVKKAWMVRKSVKHFPERPLYVLGIEFSGGWNMDEANSELIRQLSQLLTLPGECFVVNLNNRDNAPLPERLRGVAGQAFFERERFALGGESSAA